jgi:hypothetical protein
MRNIYDRLPKAKSAGFYENIVTVHQKTGRPVLVVRVHNFFCIFLLLCVGMTLLENNLFT